MSARPATLDDLDQIVELQRRWDVSWFGAVEHSADEVEEFLGYAAPLAENSLLTFDAGRLTGVALRFGTSTSCLVDPEIDVRPVLDHLLPWFADRTGSIEVLSQDAAGTAVVEQAGWTHSMSAFDLIRKVTPEFELPAPLWPDGVIAHDLDPADAEAIHRLIYVDAGWAETPGHPDRTFEDWRSIFLTDHIVASQQVIARRGERIVGVAMGRTWDDGTGWISQLATAKDERGRGVGRALLLEALRRRVQAGATSLGLAVQASNRGALQMYLGAGLEIDREWKTYTAP